ncbi:MAG: hypothetical protein HY901_08235 [Deltaproteobacteria bacterium]|nr:hypothetical protein [Deltaproteobacteria bacterium]
MPKITSKIPFVPVQPSMTGSVAAPKAVAQASEPEYSLAPNAKGLVDAHKRAESAQSQVAMVNGSVEINQAADELLRSVAEELSSQLSDRGQETKANDVMANLEKFFEKTGPARGYRLDPERGTMASLEDNGERMDKVMAQLETMVGELRKVNAEPANECQQAYNRQAYGESIAQEGVFALAFEKAYNKAPDTKAVIEKAERFFQNLPGRVESQVESQGGSMEPLERSGALARALAKQAEALAR